MNINIMYLAANGNGETAFPLFWILFIGIAIYAFKSPIAYHLEKLFKQLKK